MYDLGFRIKELRLKRGLSQRELARRINKSFSVVCGYETNAQLPPLDVVVSIASVLNVSLDYLMGFDSDTVYSTKSLTDSQREIIESLFAEFVNPSSGGSILSPNQIHIIQRLMQYFSEANACPTK